MPNLHGDNPRSSGIPEATAQVQAGTTSHFSWRNNNISFTNHLTHQHLGEITELLTQLQPNYNSKIHFIPYRGNFSLRGILINGI